MKVAFQKMILRDIFNIFGTSYTFIVILKNNPVKYIKIKLNKITLPNSEFNAKKIIKLLILYK